MKGSEIVRGRKYLLSAGASWGERIDGGAFPGVCLEKDPTGKRHSFELFDATTSNVPSRRVIRRWTVADDAEFVDVQAEREMAAYKRKIQSDIKDKRIAEARDLGQRALALLELVGYMPPAPTAPAPIRGSVDEYETWTTWIQLPAQVIIDLCQASVLLRRSAVASS